MSPTASTTSALTNRQNPFSTGTSTSLRRDPRATAVATPRGVHGSSAGPGGSSFFDQSSDSFPVCTRSSGTDWYDAAFDSGPTTPIVGSENAWRLSVSSQRGSTTSTSLFRRQNAA